jgi:CRP-like cAMP-binding protein
VQSDKHSGNGRARRCKPGIIEAESQISNSILTSLPKSEYQAVLPHLEFVEMRWRYRLHEPTVPMEFGYFPNGGIVSLLIPGSDGRSAEVGMVGKDGFVGLNLMGGMSRTPQIALVQVASTATRLSAEALNRVVLSCTTLRALLFKYALIQGMEDAQTAACNRLHDLPQRLARWLLMNQDRLSCDVLPYTQEMLATMLGTGRPSVTLAARELERNGIIKQGRGNIEVLDRGKLEAFACECHAVMRAHIVAQS